MLPPTTYFTIFPYTTLFRSRGTGPLRRVLRGRARTSVQGPVLRDREPPRRRRAHAGRVPEAVGAVGRDRSDRRRSEEHTSQLQSRRDLVCRLLLEKKKSDNL